MKRFIKFVLVYLFTMFSISIAVGAGFVYAEAYKANYEKIGGDVDYLVFDNQTNDDLMIRYSFRSVCGVKCGKRVKIRIGIDAGKYAVVQVPVTFEVKTMDGEIKNVSWTMDGRHNDINITLNEDDGWSF